MQSDWSHLVRGTGTTQCIALYQTLSSPSRGVRVWLRETIVLQCLNQDNSTLEDDYRKALELGQVLVAYARVMLVGPGGVGKSSLLRGLMNLPLPQVVNSTQLADLITVKSQQQPITQQLMTKATDMTMPWIKVKDDEIDEIVGLILLVANVEKGVTKSSRFQQYLEGAAAYAASKLGGLHGHNVRDDFRQQIRRIKNDVVRDVFSSAMEKARINPRAQAPESEIVTNVWDCAGQLVYLDILSAFLTPKTIFMLLYDARRDLNDRCIILSHHHGQVTENQEQNMSYLEMLFQWMASIHVTLTDNTSGSIPDYPHIITVGTHGDDPQVEAHKSEIIKKVDNKCEGKAFAHLVKKGYIVSNSSAGKGDDEDPVFKKLRKDVYQFTSQPSITIATPVAWVLFRKVVQKAALTKPILSREEALEIATSCSIPSKSFDSVLKFYHDVAVFLYFDHVPSLKDYVIASPQWLVKQLAKLLALEGFEEYHNPALWNQLRKNGILLEPLYTQVWKESGLPAEAIMDLLEKCGLAAPVDTQGKVHSFIGKKGEKVKEYFVPSALPLCSDSELRLSTQNSVKEACTLYLLFNTRYVPPGYLIRLVTALSKNKQCHISFLHRMFRNQFMLHFAGDEQNYIDEITISQHITSVHVNVSRSGQRRPPIPLFSTTCREIMKIILACSSEIEKWLPSIKVSTALACTECSTDDHFIEIYFATTTTLSQLTCQGNKICTFNPSQQHWLQISPRDEGLDPEDMITDTELRCIAEEVSRKGKCKELAEALEMTSHLQGDVTAHDLLQRWKREMQQSGIHIKSHLIHHLRCINQRNTVERLKDGQLESYTEKFKEMATEIENTLENITSFSVSAVSSSMLEETNKTLRILESQLKLTQVKLKDLPEIKKDLQEMVLQCELALAEKKRKYKILKEKLCTMENLFIRFQVRLEKLESGLNKCKSWTATMHQKQFQKAKAVGQDVESHKTTFNELKQEIQLVLNLVDEHHKPTLKGQLNDVTEWFNKLRFNARSYAVQSWLEDKESQLGDIAGVTIVQSMHIHKAKELQRDINSFQSDMDLLSQAAIQEQQKDSFETFEAEYETLKQNIVIHISALKRKRRWSLYGGAAIIGIVAIILGVLLIKPNTQSGNSMRMDKESWGMAEHYTERFPQMYDRPTLNELLVLKGRDEESVRIIERIGDRYYEFGTYLLHDNHGALLKTIAANANGNVETINREILTRWINGQGIKDVNWRTLVHALRVGPKLNTLADDIVAALEAHDRDKPDA